MSNRIKLIVVFVALVAVSLSANMAFAGCNSGRGGHHVGFRFHHPQRLAVKPAVHHHRVVVRKPLVVHQPLVVHKPLIQPVAPPLPQVAAGSSLTIPANFLGPQPGHVFLSLGATKLPCQILSWKPESVTITLPPMGIAAPQKACLHILMPHGQVMKRVDFLLTAPPEIILHD